MYLAMEIRLFSASEDEKVEEVAEKIREVIEGLYPPDLDGDVEIEVIEHAGLDCGECGTKSGRHGEI